MQGARVNQAELIKREQIFIDRFQQHKKAGTDVRLKDIRGYKAGKTKSYLIALQRLRDFSSGDVVFAN